jgi:three-Cys-motif partner protein
MPNRDLHKEPFDQDTIEKLEIYSQYLREFLFVFIHTPAPIRRIQIFDFFAGPGKDPESNLGSPLLTLKTVKETIAASHTTTIPDIRLFFNELNREKHQKLEACFSDKQPSKGISIQTDCKDFSQAFEDQYPGMAGCANLIFLDQNGVRQISHSIFERIVRMPKTDLIFFISSSMANRFKEQPEIGLNLPLNDEDYRNMNGTNVHRIISAAYRRWLPVGLTYYLGSFSIRKKANVYGLVFGSGHPLGIEKFLTIAWQHGGDANFDIDEDHVNPKEPSLFDELDKPKKVTLFQNALATKVQEREITTNKDAFIFSIESGCLARHAKEGLQKMVNDGILPKQGFAVSYDAWNKSETKPIKYHEAAPR